MAIDGVDDLIDVDIAIIDTGIDPTHPDLNVNHSMSVAFTARTKERARSGGWWLPSPMMSVIGLTGLAMEPTLPELPLRSIMKLVWSELLPVRA